MYGYKMENAGRADPSHPLYPALEVFDPGMGVYEQVFLGKRHDVFVGPDVIILRAPWGEQCVCTMAWTPRKTFVDVALRSEKPPAIADVMQKYMPEKSLRKLKHFPEWPALQARLLALSSLTSRKSRQLKVGVLYIGRGQANENDFFGNEHVSGGGFDRFLDAIGERVELQGFSGYCGGLDTANGTTGSYSVFAAHRGCEIMCHVSTLLPSVASCHDQSKRRRHFAHDRVTVVYIDDANTAFSPSSITRTTAAVFIIVRPGVRPSSLNMRVIFRTDCGLPAFGPSLPACEVELCGAFRDPFWCKVQNAYRAVAASRDFVAGLQQNQDVAMREICSWVSKKSPVDQDNDLFAGAGDGAGVADGEWTVEGIASSAACLEGNDAISVSTILALHNSTASVASAGNGKSGKVLCWAAWSTWLLFGSTRGLFAVDADVAKSVTLDELHVPAPPIELLLGAPFRNLAVKGEVLLAIVGNEVRWCALPVLFSGTHATMAPVPGLSPAHLLASSQEVGSDLTAAVAVKKSVAVLKWKTGSFEVTARESFPGAPLGLLFGSACVIVASRRCLFRWDLPARGPPVPFYMLPKGTLPRAVHMCFTPTGGVFFSWGASSVVVQEEEWREEKTPSTPGSTPGSVLSTPTGSSGFPESESSPTCVRWSVQPQGWAVAGPYIVAITRGVLEVRTLASGSCVQVFEHALVGDLAAASGLVTPDSLVLSGRAADGVTRVLLLSLNRGECFVDLDATIGTLPAQQLRVPRLDMMPTSSVSDSHDQTTTMLSSSVSGMSSHLNLASGAARGPSMKFEITTSDFEVIAWDKLANMTVVGKGGFGVVYRARYRFDDVAVKVLLSTTRPDWVQSFLEEIAVCAKIRHRNCIFCVGFVNTVDKLALVTEYAANGSLHEHVHPSPGEECALSLGERSRILFEVSKALHYLHDVVDMCHRDVKPRNILLDEHFVAKVADFGLAGLKSSNVNGAGTGRYAPMEVLLGDLAGPRADIYAFGVVVYETLTGNIPFDHLTQWSDRLESLFDLPGNIDTMEPWAAALVKQCCDPKQDRRPSSALVASTLDAVVNS